MEKYYSENNDKSIIHLIKKLEGVKRNSDDETNICILSGMCQHHSFDFIDVNAILVHLC